LLSIVGFYFGTAAASNKWGVTKWNF
jgi:hypothetical protein